jgi:hypothetical protein
MAWGSVTAQVFSLASVFGSAKRSGAPTTLYFALLYAASPASALGDEPTIGTGSYARVSKTNDDALWTINTGDATMTNAVSVTWPLSTAAWTEPTLNQWAAFDAATAGTCWAFGELTTTVDVSVAGRVPVAAVGAFDVIQLAV